MRTLITGGAGFVGANLAARLLAEGDEVVVLDSLARAGSEENLRWLQTLGGRLVVRQDDVRDFHAVESAATGVERVFHLAAQVAVTTSLSDPRADFEVNAGGTLNVLEAARRATRTPFVLLSSTNKVYGALGGLPLRLIDGRALPDDPEVAARGIAEDQPLDLQSPYGCSKGAADQYVLDYARSFGLPAVVLRMSCIYGPLQRGNEDQGWVVHFARSVARGAPIRLFGDGRQVRDLLFVDDLVDAVRAAWAECPRTRGRAFNVGGGPANAASLLDVLGVLETVCAKPAEVSRRPERKGDQRYYVSDTRAMTAATGWRPRVQVQEGLVRTCAWIRDTDGDRRRSAGRAS